MISSKKLQRTDAVVFTRKDDGKPTIGTVIAKKADSLVRFFGLKKALVADSIAGATPASSNAKLSRTVAQAKLVTFHLDVFGSAPKPEGSNAMLSKTIAKADQVTHHFNAFSAAPKPAAPSDASQGLSVGGTPKHPASPLPRLGSQALARANDAAELFVKYVGGLDDAQKAACFALAWGQDTPGIDKDAAELFKAVKADFVNGFHVSVKPDGERLIDSAFQKAATIFVPTDKREEYAKLLSSKEPFEDRKKAALDLIGGDVSSNTV